MVKIMNQTPDWKEIEGFEGYFITPNGEVGTKWVNKGRHGLFLQDEIKVMKCSRTTSKRYKMVRLGGRSGKWETVHRLVYKTFIGDIPKGLFVRHLNDNPVDNRVENLKLGTQKDNMQDAKRNGLMLGRAKKIDDDQKAEIIRLKHSNPKMPNRLIADKYKVSRKTIDRVITENRGKRA